VSVSSDARTPEERRTAVRAVDMLGVRSSAVEATTRVERRESIALLVQRVVEENKLCAAVFTVLRLPPG